MFIWTNRAALGIEATKFVNEAALFITDRAKALAPYDTGNLANSITPNLAAPSPNPVATVGTGVEYAPYQEFGTRYMRAQPFLGPALAEARAIFR